jgi:hypothetical protein
MRAEVLRCGEEWCTGTSTRKSEAFSFSPSEDKSNLFMQVIEGDMLVCSCAAVGTAHDLTVDWCWPNLANTWICLVLDWANTWISGL